MRYLFFVNPTAGKGILQENIKKSIKTFFENREDEFQIHITRFKGDAEETARKAAQTGEELTVFACGGEGTVYEVLNGIVGYNNVAMGVIPCGSANDFLKFFDNKEPFSSIEAQIDGTKVEMDIIKAGERYCLNGCSVGMDAMVARDMAIFKGWPFVSGAMAYKLAIVKTYLKKLGVFLKISVDDKPAKDIGCLFAVVANAPYYGGGYKGAPNAVPYDGKLDLTLVDIISKIKILKFLPLYESGKHSRLDCCTLSNCKSMEFWSEKVIPVNLDGEIVETANMRFEIVKKQLNLYFLSE